jgi:hypothetical protein
MPASSIAARPAATAKSLIASPQCSRMGVCPMPKIATCRIVISNTYKIQKVEFRLFQETAEIRLFILTGFTTRNYQVCIWDCQKVQSVMRKA